MTRHQMRESAFLLTFERLFNDAPREEILALARECETVEVDERVERLFCAVDEKKEELDREIARYDVPTQITGYEYEVYAAMEAVSQGKKECPQMPHAETLQVMELLDSLRREWGVVYPFERS